MSSGSGSRSRLPAVLAFLVVVSLGEALALAFGYENNSFLRAYASHNFLMLVSEVVGLVALSLVSGYLVYRRSLTPRGAKGPGIFHRLGDIVTKRHKVVILVWLIIAGAAVPLALRVGQTVTSQNSSDTSNPTESIKAQQIISQEFPRQESNSSALIVIVGADVTDGATKQFVLNLETRFLTPGALPYLQKFTSIYSTERTILVGTIRPLAPVVYGLVTQVNVTSFIVYGVPSIYLGNWVPANATNSATADSIANETTWTYLTSPGLNQSLGPNAPLALGYYQLFYQSWTDHSSTSLPSLRASQAINATVPEFLAGPPPLSPSLSGFVNASWMSLSSQTWNQTVPVFQLVQSFMSSSSPSSSLLPISLLQSIFALGPSPSVTMVENLASQIVNNGSLSTYPLLPADLVGQFVSPKKDTMLVVVDFSKSPGTFSSASSDPVLQDVLDMRKDVSSVLASDPGPQRVYVTGSLATTADSFIESSQDIQRIDPVTIGAILVLVGVFFFAVATPFVPLTAIGLALVIAEGLVFLISTYIVPVQDTTLTFLTTIMLGVGTDYAIFLIARYREERVEGKNRNDAVHTSVKWVG